LNEATEKPGLERRIGLPGAILLSFNGVLGAAIFALPATLAADFGSFSPWLFPLVALVSLLIIVPFAFSAGSFPESGGPAEYGRVFGRFVGFELGWIYYIARTAAFAANANVLTAYLARWWAPAGEGLARAAVIIGTCALLVFINIIGVRRALAVLGGLTLLKALPLVLAAIAAILLTLPPPAPGPLPALSELEAGALLVFYAFVGFENVVVPAGETKRPATVLPRAIFVTMASTTLLYFLVQLAFISALPGGGTDEKAPLIDLGEWLAGPLGAAILTLTALASLAGNLHGIMTSTSRVTYALARRRDLPGWFAWVHPTFVWLAVVSVLARLITYAITIAALPRAPESSIRHPAIYVIGAAGIALCIWGMAQADLDSWRTLGLLAVGGGLLYWIATWTTRRGVGR
jgi:APA family basic amino acid/polyamine antiporter